MMPPPDLTSDDPDDISSYLLDSGHARHLVCDERCRFVMEGYPESGNVLAADLFHLLNRTIKFAHHTHSPLNLRLGALYKIPRIVLLRRPFEAITAFVVAMEGRIPAEDCVHRYVDFHRGVAQMDQFIVAEYALVMKDINAIVARLNERFPKNPLAYSADVRGDVERAHERRRQRLAAANRAEASAEERASAEARAAEAVRAILAHNDEPEGLYALVLSRG